MTKSLFNFAALVLVVALLSGCGSKSTPSGGECNGIPAAGISLSIGGNTIATAFGDSVSGSLEILAGDSLIVNVEFLAADSSRISLAPNQCPEFELGWSVSLPEAAAVEIVTGERWRVRVIGIEPANITLNFMLLEDEQVVYETEGITTHVSSAQPHQPIAATAVAVSRYCNDLATWNYDEVKGPNVVTGKIVVEAGKILDHLAVEFLDSLTDYDGLRFAIEPEDLRYSLGILETNTDIAAVRIAPGTRWQLEVEGKQAGHTAVTFQLLFNGVPELTAGPFTIIVREPIGAVEDSSNFAITISGIWKVVVRDGEILTTDTLCGDRPSPGMLEDTREVLTLGLYSLRLLNGCERQTPSTSRYSLAFDFADPCIARVVAHPVHWGEYFVWHIYGYQSGQTSLRIHLVRSDNTIEFTSPPIPVVIR